MALMERVAALLRANVNELVDRAEDPETMLKQLLLDMENQLLQVKTQVAIAIAEQYLLQKKAKEQEEAALAWHDNAELAMKKGKEEMARAALERALSHEQMGGGFAHQVKEQTMETTALRASYNSLQAKLQETRAQCEMLVSQHRRARSTSKTPGARLTESNNTSRVNAMAKMKARIENAEAEAYAGREIFAAGSLESDFAKLVRDEKVDRLLDELRQKQLRMLQAG